VLAPSEFPHQGMCTRLQQHLRHLILPWAISVLLFVVTYSSPTSFSDLPGVSKNCFMRTSLYNETTNHWYAHIPVEVGVEETKSGKKSKYIAHGERKVIQVETPKGNKIASIDLGINVLASIVVDDGTWLLYKGVRAKEDYFYLQKKIAEIQSLADKTKNLGEYDAYEELAREKRRLFKKLTRRLLHLYRNLASHMVKTLNELGVSTIYLGCPFNIAQEKGNKFTVNLWSYRKLMEAIELKAQEYGIKVFELVEYNTSKYCAYHGVEVKRHPRGVVSCPKGHKLHSDLNGALNILRKAVDIMVSTVKKPLFPSVA